MKGSIRNQLLIKLYEGITSDRELFDSFDLPVGIFLKLLKAIKTQDLIYYDETRIPRIIESDYIYPYIDLKLRLTELGKQYTKRSLIDKKNQHDINPDRLDYLQLDKAGVCLPHFENMSFKEFEDKYLSVAMGARMDKRIMYYILTGIHAVSTSIKKREEIKDTIAWLEEFPIAHDKFVSALDKYDKNELDRHLLDDLRFALEQFLKKFFGNDKPVEKQKVDLKNHFKELNVSTDIISMYEVVYSKFCNYQNNSVKHNENYTELEMEFVIEVSSSLMKLLLRTKSSAL